MSQEEFPSLQESVNTNSTERSTLGASWAEVAQADASSHEEEDPSKDSSLENTSYADVAGHEKKLAEEYPSLQEAASGSKPTSSGVEDLLNAGESTVATDPGQPPNPDRSFADVTSNKGYPLPESNKAPTNDLPPLSDLPDVKDMLNEPSVNVPPPPQSFAEMAAKEVPPELRPLSDRTQSILKEQAKQEENQDPYAVNDENFPSLGQSNLMATHNAKEDEKGVYTEISKLSQAADAIEEDAVMVNKKEDKQTKSFADITASNMENAPPSAQSHVDQLPVYDEDTILLEKRKRDKRKEDAVEYGNNNELIQAEEKEQVKKADLTKKDIKEGKDRSIKETSEDALIARLQVFDKTHSGKITIFDTLFALYRLGYPLLTIVPATFLMHIRLSALSSPHNFPFIYRSLFDLISLPIYTKNLGYALTYKTPMLSESKEQVVKMVEKYGSGNNGLGYWDGMRAIGHFEKLRWWQLGLWAVHRIQWTLTYTMLYDPSNRLVTTPTLISLNKAAHRS